MTEGRPLRVMVAEDDPHLRVALKNFLQERGLLVTAVEHASQAVESIQREREPYDVVLTSLAPNGADGTLVFEAAKRRGDTTEVVVMPGFASLETAIQFMHRGAFDYITKPFKLAEIEIVLNKIAERRRLLEENRKLSDRIQNLYTRLDLLKENREKRDRFFRETSNKLDDQSQRIDQCLDLLRQILGTNYDIEPE